jgi:hypothetical protein
LCLSGEGSGESGYQDWETGCVCASVFISQPIQLQLNTLKRNQKSLTMEVLDKEFPNMNRQMWQRTGYAIMAAFFLSSVRIYSYL